MLLQRTNDAKASKERMHLDLQDRGGRRRLDLLDPPADQSAGSPAAACGGAGRGGSRFVAEAVGALGDLSQHPVGGGQVVRVEAGVEAPGDGGDGVG